MVIRYSSGRKLTQGLRKICIRLPKKVLQEGSLQGLQAERSELPQIEEEGLLLPARKAQRDFKFKFLRFLSIYPSVSTSTLGFYLTNILDVT